MSFSIFALGSKDEVRETVSKSTGYGDVSQHDICKDAVLKTLDGIPDGSTVRVSASGHHNVPVDKESVSGSFEVKFEYARAALPSE